jgi:hypothetical protein
VCPPLEVQRYDDGVRHRAHDLHALVGRERAACMNATAPGLTDMTGCLGCIFCLNCDAAPWLSVGICDRQASSPRYLQVVGDEHGIRCPRSSRRSRHQNRWPRLVRAVPRARDGRCQPQTGGFELGGCSHTATLFPLPERSWIGRRSRKQRTPSRDTLTQTRQFAVNARFEVRNASLPRRSNTIDAILTPTGDRWTGKSEFSGRSIGGPDPPSNLEFRSGGA